MTPWDLVSVRCAFKVQQAYLKRRHGSGGTGAAHGAVLKLLFFGAHLDGFKTRKGYREVIVWDLGVWCAERKDEWRAGT